MTTLLSNLFSIIYVVFIFYLTKNKGNVLGLSKFSSYVNSAWIILFMLMTSYMFYFAINNAIMLFSAYFLYILYFFSSNSIVPINRIFLPIYLLFCLWCGLRLADSQFIDKGIMMMIKLIMPLFFFMYSYRAFNSKESVWLFFDRISKLSILYCLFSIISIPIRTYFEIYCYFGMSIFPFALVMWLKTKQKKYLLYSFLCLSHNLVEVKRTPLLAMFAMIMLITFFKYKLKAMIPALALVILSVIAIFYIPALNERVFFNYIDPKDIDWSLMFSAETYETVNTHGRNVAWDLLLNKFYHGHEWFGCGLGTAKGWLQSPANPISESFALVHNDWIQFLCETGIFGVGILLFFYVRIILTAFWTYEKSKSNDMKLISLFLAMVTVGVVIHMYFENCFGRFGYCFPFVAMAIFYQYKRFFYNTVPSFNKR